MAKENITTTNSLLSWDDYKNKSPEQALPLIYARASNTAEKECNWYWNSIKTKRRISVFLRLLTLVSLILGTLLPILSSLYSTPEFRLQLTQCGVAALALGGLLQVADRVFGWSSGWLRYVTTVTAMENLTRKFELEWAGYLITKIGNIDNNDMKQLFDLAKSYEENMVKLQSDETDKWVAEFNTGMALLGDMIKTQKEDGQKAIDEVKSAIEAKQKEIEQKEKASTNGAIELNLVYKTKIKPVKITIDDRKCEEYFGTTWSSLGISPGQHLLKIEFNGAEDIPQTIIKVIDVPPGSVVRENIELS